jgi:hypothetical protein
MRDILSKVTGASMIAGAALIVAACGPTETTVNETEINALETDPMYDVGNDVTAIDGTMGNDMTMDNMTVGNLTVENMVVEDDPTANEAQ